MFEEAERELDKYINMIFLKCVPFVSIHSHTKYEKYEKLN